MLLFQDLAVVPLLILIPALAQPGGAVYGQVVVGLLKTVVVRLPCCSVWDKSRCMHG